MLDKTIIGQTEEVRLPQLSSEITHARIDTGAKTSAIWVSEVREHEGKLTVTFFGPGLSLHTREPIVFDEYTDTVVASSNGEAEQRYKVRLLVEIGGKRIRAWFTLADRSKQVYPILIGRNILRGKFVVDVALKPPHLLAREKQRTKILAAKRQEKK